MTWQEIWNDYINVEPGIVAIALRLLCAMTVGTLIGMEREYTHRPAGPNLSCRTIRKKGWQK